MKTSRHGFIVVLNFEKREERDQTVVTPAAVCFSGVALPAPLVRQTCSAARMVVDRKRPLERDGVSKRFQQRIRPGLR